MLLAEPQVVWSFASLLCFLDFPGVFEFLANVTCAFLDEVNNMFCLLKHGIDAPNWDQRLRGWWDAVPSQSGTAFDIHGLSLSE